jgi:hypothetical protein
MTPIMQNLVSGFYTSTSYLETTCLGRRTNMLATFLAFSNNMRKMKHVTIKDSAGNK